MNSKKTPISQKHLYFSRINFCNNTDNRLEITFFLSNRLNLFCIRICYLERSIKGGSGGIW